MERAWTLQEGVLARDCVLQLHDGVLKVDYIDFRHYKDPNFANFEYDSPFTYYYHKIIGQRITSIVDNFLRRPSLHNANRFSDITSISLRLK